MKIKKIILSILIASANLLVLTSFKDVSAQNSEKIIQNIPGGQIDWANKLVIVKGQGAPPNTGGLPQRRLKARLAARTDAYRNLAEIVNGVQVTSETTVKNFVTISDITKLRVDAVVKGARQYGEEKYLSDGSVEINLALSLFGNGSVASALELGNYVKNKETIESFLPDTRIASLNDFAISEKKPEKIKIADNSNVTGLIIDASSLGVEPAMSPFIVGGGKIVYAGGKIDIDPDNIVKYGVNDYANDIEAAKKDIKRIGALPMIIEAKGATGKPSRTNILLDEITLQSLKEANEKYKFLNNLNVVIVI
jgi:hypothetical protein